MGFRVIPYEDSSFELVIVDEPKYIVALDGAPNSRESLLNSGRWLVVSFAIWDIRDRQSILDAIEFAKKYNGDFRLGIRPYQYITEHASWLPEIEKFPPGDNIIKSVDQDGKRAVAIEPSPGMSPLWFTFDSGKLLTVRYGSKSISQMKELFIRDLLKQS